MSEGVNKVGNIESYKYLNQELQIYDTDNDGQLSVFEMDNIQDKSGLELLMEEIGGQIQQEDVPKNIEALENKLTSVKEEQGIFSSAWNSIKCFTGIGSSTKKCEQAIQDYKDGKISYEEADSIISGFSEKQKSSVNLVSNILTGVAAVAVVGSAVMTGGLSLGVILTAGAVGGATKAGLKFIDRATNKKHGDALDAKEIAKDALTGAVDGAVSVATMGMGATAVSAKTVASQTIQETVKQGAIAGAKAGAIAGGITGASDYTIEAALEEDVDFNAGDLISQTVQTAVGGAVAGGVMGGISSGFQYKTTAKTLEARMAKYPKLSKEEIAELSDQAARLHNSYEKNINQATKQIDDEFGSSAQKITGRAKGDNSIFDKLADKYSEGKFTTINDENCFRAIADGYGTRIQMSSLTAEQSRSIIEKGLEGSDITYEQFVKYVSGDTMGLDDSAIESLKDLSTPIINTLKEAQNKEVFETLISGIKSGEITITEINNYGDDISSYFTKSQLEEIADAYNSVTGQKLTVVTKMDDEFFREHPNFTVGEKGKFTVETEKFIFTDKGAMKDSGYASTQANTVHTFNDDTIGLGELQIRGTEVNDFADIEHIPYDIRQGKITESDTKYFDIYSTIKSMSKESYKAYNSYLTKVYDWLRLKELGVESAEPILSGTFFTEATKEKAATDITEQVISLLSRSGLSLYKH